MIVVDTSALIATLTGEAERERINATIAAASTCLLSAASFVECGIVLSARHGASGMHHLRLYVSEAGIDVVPFDEDQADLAVHAWERYGRGRHRAALNLGDCFSYALAAARGAPLLYVGDDFAMTDVARA